MEKLEYGNISDGSAIGKRTIEKIAIASGSNNPALFIRLTDET